MPKPTMTLRGLWSVLRKAVAGYSEDNVPRMGAALAYYTLSSLAPVLIVVIAVAGTAFGAETVRTQIVGQIQGLMGEEGARTVETMLAAAGRRPSGLLVSILGAVTFVLGATGAFLELQGSLNKIWRVKPKDDGHWLQNFLKQRLISFGLVLGFGFLLLTALVVSAALSALYSYLGPMLPGAAVIWRAAETVVSIGVMTVLFGLIYKVMPDVDLRWKDVWVGALFTAGLFNVGRLLIGLYLGRGNFATSYGAAASIVVILVWVYYSSQILLFGAEFTRAYVRVFEPKPEAAPGAESQPAPAT